MSARPTCSDCNAAQSIGLKQCFGCWKDAPKPRPTGVPLTADNVADAQECRDDAVCARVWRVNARGAWETDGNTLAIDPDLMAMFAPVYGTVVTKWREKP